MKKGIISLLMGICLITMTTGNTTTKAVSETKLGGVKTIVVADGEYGNNDPTRVYQLVGKKMNKTNRTTSTFNDKGIVHWHAQEIQADGERWWKVGENQYFKLARVNVVNLDAMKAHSLIVENYANFDGKNGVSTINEG